MSEAREVLVAVLGVAVALALLVLVGAMFLAL